MGDGWWGRGVVGWQGDGHRSSCHPITTSGASNHPSPVPSRIDITNSDRSAIGNRLTAACPAAAFPFAAARFRLVPAGGVTDRRPTVGTNVDRARSFALAVFLDRDLTLSRLAAFALAAAARLSWFRRNSNPPAGAGFSSLLVATRRGIVRGFLLGS
jgi:hypothetical protein